MHITSQRSSPPRLWAQKLYLGMVTLILLGVLCEGLLIGPSLFADTHWGRALHGYLGALLFLLMVLLPVIAKISRLPGNPTALSVVLLALALLEVISASQGRKLPVLAALHPANALLMAGVLMVMFIQGWQQARKREQATGNVAQ